MRRTAPLELIGCRISGHELVGVDARELRAEDGVYAREMEGVRASLPALRRPAARAPTGRARPPAPAGERWD